jgi:hypothetical protein
MYKSQIASLVTLTSVSALAQLGLAALIEDAFSVCAADVGDSYVLRFIPSLFNGPKLVLALEAQGVPVLTDPSDVLGRHKLIVLRKSKQAPAEKVSEAPPDFLAHALAGFFGVLIDAMAPVKRR